MNPELVAMADAQHSEQTESKTLNTELETPTLDAATEHQQPSTEPTYNHQDAEYHDGDAGQSSASESHGATVATAEAADEDMSMEDFAAAHCRRSREDNRSRSGKSLARDS